MIFHGILGQSLYIFANTIEFIYLQHRMAVVVIVLSLRKGMSATCTPSRPYAIWHGALVYDFCFRHKSSPQVW